MITSVKITLIMFANRKIIGRTNAVIIAIKTENRAVAIKTFLGLNSGKSIRLKFCKVLHLAFFERELPRDSEIFVEFLIAKC
jgi:hypothetical protein